MHSHQTVSAHAPAPRAPFLTTDWPLRYGAHRHPVTPRRSPPRPRAAPQAGLAAARTTDEARGLQDLLLLLLLAPQVRKGVDDDPENEVEDDDDDHEEEQQVVDDSGGEEGLLGRGGSVSQAARRPPPAARGPGTRRRLPAPQSDVTTSWHSLTPGSSPQSTLAQVKQGVKLEKLQPRLFPRPVPHCDVTECHVTRWARRGCGACPGGPDPTPKGTVI